MLELNNRQKKLLKELLSQNIFLKTVDLAKMLEVSQKTIVNDLVVIEEQLDIYNSTVERKSRLGIKVNINNEERQILLKMLNENTLSQDNYSIINRQLKILKKLLIDEEVVSYQKLSEYFLVSKSSISKDMEFIQSFLKRSNTVDIIAGKQGTSVAGTEVQFQYSLKKYSELLLKENNIIDEKDFFKYAKKVLNELYPNDIVEIVFDETLNYERKLGREFSYYYIKSLIITVIIYIYRKTKGKKIEYTFSDTIEDKSYETRALLENVANRLNIEISSQDIEYLNIQLVAHGMKINDMSESEYKDIVLDIMYKMSDIMNLDFKWDKELYNSLLLHIVPMIYRLKMGIKIHNPMLEDIKKNYSVVLNATWYVMTSIAKKLEITLTEDEVAFITLHFQVSINKNEDSHKILVVCPSGITTSELIVNKIKKHLPAKDIISVIGIRELYKKDLSKIDLIISSVKLDFSDERIVYVSPLITPKELKDIYIHYADLSIKNINKNESLKYQTENIYQFIDEKLLFTKCNFNNKNEVLDFLIEQFEKLNYVTSEFRELIYIRENNGPTDLETFVAIPHAMPETVIESKIGIVTLDKPIMWTNKKVHTIILLAFSEKDLKKVKTTMSELYAIVKEEESINKIFKNKSKEKILKILGGF